MTSKTNTKQVQKLRRIRDDFPYFSKNFLKVKDKAGQIVRFELNQAQRYIHSMLEKQRIETGKVRALVLKARQMGSSTYLEGRYYHKASLNKGKSVFILTHEAESTKKLFSMARRFYDNVPDIMKPSLRHSNAKELIFDGIDSQYYVGTAGNADVGRGGTVQYLHGSETAHWDNTDQIVTGLMQSVPDMPDTEIVLESTANGLGNMFYEMCIGAINGENDYQLIFLPWFWMDEYESEVEGFEPTEEEFEYASLFLAKYPKTQQMRKLAWRRRKTAELGRSWKFKQEYPSTPQEAFVVSGDSLCRAEDIVRARQCKLKDKNAPMVIGVDPARKGDRTVIAFRRGRELAHYYTFDDMDEMRLVGILTQLIDKHNPAMVNIDVGLGYGTIDRLLELGYRNINGIHFGERAIESDVYRNKRAEMWCKLAEWLEQPDVNIPDNDALHADLMSVPEIQHTSDGTIRLVSKEKIREQYGKSPDIGDAVALTFALPVHRIAERKEQDRFRKKTESHATWKKIPNKVKYAH